MSRYSIALVCLLLAVLNFGSLSRSASASTLTVPARYATIQAAINAAVNGDTVLIADGTYTGPGNVDVDFGGKNITLTSQNGAATTIIDCQGTSSVNHRGFYLHSGETSAVISGLTIQNGYEYDTRGGGIYNFSLGTTIQNCVIKNNTVSLYGGGGGIDNAGGSLTLTNCVLSNNSAAYGGGIENETGASLAVTNCVIIGNSSNYGAGIAQVSNGTLTVINCTLTGNSASSAGGGLDYFSSNGSTCNFINTILYGDSGGETVGSTASATNCDVQGSLPGVGNINVDPQFANGPSDVHLKATSPCLGAGTPNRAPPTTIDGKTRPNPPSIGAYELAPSTASTAVTLSSSLNPSTPGQRVTFNATLNASGAVPTGSITFVIDGTAAVPVALSGKSASYSLSTLTGGTHTVVAAYSGDAVYAPVSSPMLTQTVTLISTTTTLISSSNPSVTGKPVTFTATVKAATGTPTGTVNFSITDTRPGGGTLQTPVTLSNGTAVYTTTFLAAAQFRISATYAGDTGNGVSTSAVLTQTVSAATSTTSLTSNLNPSSVNQAVTFTAAITGSNPSGTVTLTDTTTGTTLGTGSFSGGGPIAFSVNNLGGGAHKITASYGGDSANSSSVSPALTQTVKPVATTTTVFSRINPSITGQSNTFAATVSTTGSFVVAPTGTVTFKIDGAAQPPITLSSGYNVTFDASSLSSGSHTVTATYSGDASYSASTSAILTQVVNTHISPQYVSLSGSDSNPGTQAAPKLTIQAAMTTALSGDTVVIEDGIYTGPGNVDLRFGGKILTVTSQNGPAKTIIDCGGSVNADHGGFSLFTNYGSNLGSDGGTISGLTIQHAVAGGNFPGSPNYPGGAILSHVALTVQNCIIKNNTAGQGGGLDIESPSGTASVINCVFTGNTAGSGGGLFLSAGGTGTISVVNCTVTGNTAIGTGATPPGGGIAAYAYSYPPGNPAITLTNTIVYGDTGGEIASNGQSPSSLYVSYCDIQGGYVGIGNINADPLFVNASADFHLLPGSPCTGAGTTTAAPALTIDGKTRPTPPSIGAYEAIAVGTSADSVALTSSVNPSLPSQSVTFTATVIGAGLMPTGFIIFTVDGTAQPATRLSAGMATYATSSLSIGSHTVVATYTGDINYTAATSAALTQKVALATTSTALTSSANPSSYGQQITLTAVVSGKAPTGTVTFTDTANSTTLGTAAVTGIGTSNTGAAAFSITSLTAGIHQITATYSGDSSNSVSTSPILTQTVQTTATVTTLTSDLNPSVAGQVVGFTVSLRSASALPPTGSLTFTIDGSSIAPTTLPSGFAGTYVYALSYLSPGLHTISVAYSGDSNFLASASASLTQKVLPHINPLYVSPTGNDSNPGTQTSPKLTIQAAVNATILADTVYVADGIYTGPGNVDVDFGGHVITLTSQNGPSSTIIDCQGSAATNHRAFTLHSGEQGGLISGFTIKNGYEGNGDGSGNGNAQGGAIDIFSASLVIQNCIFEANTADYGGGIFYNTGSGTPSMLLGCLFIGNKAAVHGGGIYSYNAGSSAFTISNCVFFGNTAQVYGGGLYDFTNNSNGTALISCTFTGNTAGVLGSGVYNNSQNSGTVTLTNTILYGDNNAESAGTSLIANNSDIQGGYAGTGNISIDPLFANYPTDLHLSPGSPCLGAGTASGAPATTIDGQTRPNPPSIGAYEVYLAPTFIVVGNASGVAGQSVTLSASLDPGTRGLPGAVLQFSVDGTAVGTAVTGDNSTSSGPARLSYTIPVGFAPGSHTVTASFAGDSTDSPASGTGTLTVFTGPANLVNDTDSGFTYGGTGWKYYPNRGAGDVNGDVHATQNNGDAVSFSFLGSSLSVLSETNADEGTVDISIDGVFQQTVNCYSATRLGKQTIYSVSGLAAGAHVLKLVKTGGSYMLLDALQATPAPSTSSLVNDNGGGIGYTGTGWSYSANRGLGDFANDVHATTVNGDAFSYTFTGTSISYLAETNSDEGNVQVYLDNALQTTVSAYSPTRASQQALWSKSGLASGTHTLKVVKQDGQYMLVDALQVSPALPSSTLVNDADSGITYTGSGWIYSSGRGFGDVSSDVHATTANGSSVSYTFTGSAISWLTETNSDEGNVQVYVDGVLQATVSCATASRQVQQAVYSTSGLAAGSHTLKLVKISGSYLVVDAFRVQ